ncbi:MAG: hypothetical protein F6K38_36145 [Moorea sp. SIO3B2]|uniref:hypothetical protein n=1 Tax=Moorena sp. SIO1G6 TaxID=2607840 RepID=UPI0013CC5529|nr:hypothetical protein [Moorena sp. SIO1G6]NEP36649.1 hypothetical protein [Moorena sp. SIO3B2]
MKQGHSFKVKEKLENRELGNRKYSPFTFSRSWFPSKHSAVSRQPSAVSRQLK